MKSGLVVEDLAAAQDWLAEALVLAFPTIDVVIAPNVKRAITTLDRVRPDIALVDLNLPDGTGNQVIAEIKTRFPETFVIVTSIYNDDQHLFPALQAGADGYILKEDGRINLAKSLQKIQGGEPPLSPQIAHRLMGFFHASPTEPTEPLSTREEEVLALIAKGYTLQEIAEQISLSRNTIATYVKRIYNKLHISSRSEATIEATRRGIVTTKI